MDSINTLPEAIAALADAQADYSTARADASAMLSEVQQRRERAMRNVAALGLSHRRIAELTDLSHTRVNQILGVGSKKPPTDAHFPPGFLEPPSTVSSAAIRVMAEQNAHSWTVSELGRELGVRGWPTEDLEAVLVGLATDGVILSTEGGGFTLHAYADSR
jgi:hypothetical protein